MRQAEIKGGLWAPCVWIRDISGAVVSGCHSRCEEGSEKGRKRGGGKADGHRLLTISIVLLENSFTLPIPFWFRWWGIGMVVMRWERAILRLPSQLGYEWVGIRQLA